MFGRLVPVAAEQALERDHDASDTVEPTGLEPVAFWLPARRSPS
jgi:hypothetical protein